MTTDDLLSLYYNSYIPVSGSVNIDYVTYLMYCIDCFNIIGLVLFSLVGFKLGLKFLSWAGNF